MNINTTSISVNYSDSKLRILVEEFITMRKREFTFKELCSYVLYWAKEEGKTANTGLYDSNQLCSADCEKISRILHRIIIEGRITCETDSFTDNTQFVKVKD